MSNSEGSSMSSPISMPSWVFRHLNDDVPLPFGSNAGDVVDEGMVHNPLDDLDFINRDHRRTRAEIRLVQIARRYRDRIVELEDDMEVTSYHMSQLEVANNHVAEQLSEMATRHVQLALERDLYAASTRRLRFISIVGPLVTFAIAMVIHKYLISL